MQDEFSELELTQEKDKDFDKYRADRESLKKDPDEKIWENWQGAVLLKDEIRRYCKDPIKLIAPFEDTSQFLKPSSYHLRLGNKYRVNGVDYELSDNNRILKIPPHGIAIVRTLEWVNIPGFLIGRWNLKVKMVYKGLVWVGSLQVDSGYQGFLFCPLYNLSNKEQELVYKDSIFTIDFVRTTRYDESKGCELWHSNRPTYKLGELDYQRLKSAPAEQFKQMHEEITQAQVETKRILEINKSEIEKFQSRIDSFQGITFSVLGIIVAALAFVSVSQFTDLKTESPSNWQIATWIIVLVSILVMVITLAVSAMSVLRRK